MFFDSIKDCVIPHVTGKSHAFDIWKDLCTLYQSKNQNKNIVLREKLRNTKMTDVDTVTTYLTKISQVRDELGVAGEKVEDEELVRYALNGFTAKWHTFVQGVVAREKLPDWTRLWDDFVQEETREGNFQNDSQRSEENVALLTKGKGKEGKKRKKTLVRFNVITATSSATMLVNVLGRRMKTKREQHQQKYNNMLPNLKRKFIWHQLRLVQVV